MGSNQRHTVSWSNDETQRHASRAQGKVNRRENDVEQSKVPGRAQATSSDPVTDTDTCRFTQLTSASQTMDARALLRARKAAAAATSSSTASKSSARPSTSTSTATATSKHAQQASTSATAAQGGTSGLPAHATLLPGGTMKCTVCQLGGSEFGLARPRLQGAPYE
jgi:hypothetical protein